MSFSNAFDFDSLVRTANSRNADNLRNHLLAEAAEERRSAAEARGRKKARNADMRAKAGVLIGALIGQITKAAEAGQLSVHLYRPEDGAWAYRFSKAEEWTLVESTKQRYGNCGGPSLRLSYRPFDESIAHLRAKGEFRRGDNPVKTCQIFLSGMAAFVYSGLRKRGAVPTICVEVSDYKMETTDDEGRGSGNFFDVSHFNCSLTIDFKRRPKS